MSDDLAEQGAPTFEAARFRQVMGHFCTGVTVVTAVDDDEPVGFTAQTFVPLSIEPPLVVVCTQRSSTTWPRIQKSGSFAVNVLTDEQEALCRVFATSGADKFKGVGWRPGPGTGSPILHDVLAWIEARIDAIHDGGDHEIVVARVVDMDVDDDAEDGPLLFYRGGFGRFQP